jgi:uncharacterized protein YjdB
VAVVLAVVLTSCEAAVGIAGYDDRNSGPDLSLAEIQMVSGDGQESLVASLAPERLVVEVTDEHGDPLSGAPVEWTFTQGRGLVAEGSPPRELLQAVTDAQGRSEVQWELGSTAGVQQAWVHIVVPDDPAAASVGPAGAPDSGKGKKVGFTARAKPAAPDDVSISPSSLSVAPGDSARLQAEVTDKFGNEVQDADLEWRSSDEAVAKVDDSGLMIAMDDGSAEIVAVAGAAEGTADLLVTDGSPDAEITDIEVNPSELTLAEGDTATVVATALNSSGEPVGGAEIEWTSSDPTIASVSSEGLVKANAVGAVLVAAAVACGMSACSATTDVRVPEEDTGTPGAVTDLAVVESGPTSVQLAFTQVDDGTGSPANYALRYGSPSIAWGSAYSTEVSIEGVALGATREYEYSGLDPDTDYEFQLVTYRGTLGGGATFGEFSNVVAATTGSGAEPGPAASLEVTPASWTIVGIVETIQLTARARDADGNLVSDAAFEWSSGNPGIATVSSEGLVTSTQIGAVVIAATLSCTMPGCADGITAESNGQVEEEGSPPPPPEGVLFHDGFESGDYSHTENGYGWAEASGAPDQSGGMEDSATPFEGSWSGRFRQNTSAENRLMAVGGPALDEYWFEYRIRVPTNYDHVDSPSSDNNKWAEFFLESNRGATLVWSETERNSAGDGGSRWRINWGADVNFSHTTATDNGIVLPGDAGGWMRVRYHIRIQNKGSGNANAYIQIWKNNSKIFDGTSDTWSWQGESMVHDIWQIMGYNNGEFSEPITWYVDDVRLYGQNPGW